MALCGKRQRAPVKITKHIKRRNYEKLLKWLFVAPVLFFGVWLIAFYSEDFRTRLINTVRKLLQNMANEIERSL